MLYHTYASITANVKHGWEWAGHRCKKSEVPKDLWVWAPCFIQAWIQSIDQLCSRNIMAMTTHGRSRTSLSCLSFLPHTTLHSHKEHTNCLSRKHDSTSHFTRKIGVRMFKAYKSNTRHGLALILISPTRYHFFFSASLAFPMYSSEMTIYTFFLDTISAKDICSRSLRTISTPERSVRWYLQTAKALYCAGSLGWFLEETLWGTLLWSTAQLNSHFFWYTRKTVSKKATRDIWLTEHCCCWYLCFQKDRFLAFSFVERVNSAIINKRQMSVIIWSECTW